MRQCSIIVLLLFVAGCGEKAKEAATTPATPAPSAKLAPDDPKLLIVSGAGGELAIGDPLEKAKTVFPPPSGAYVLDETRVMMNISKEGWGWSPAGKAADVTEVAAKGGKIIAIAGPTEVPQDFDAAAKAVVAKLGKPLREASGKAALMYVWEGGDYAHFYMQIKKDLGLLGYGAGHIVGPKDGLKALMFDHTNPQAFVDMVDQFGGVAPPAK